MILADVVGDYLEDGRDFRWAGSKRRSIYRIGWGEYDKDFRIQWDGNMNEWIDEMGREYTFRPEDLVATDWEFWESLSD
mgnify:FL=1